MTTTELKSSTNQMFAIVDKYGGEDKQRLMQALKQLRHEVKHECWKAYNKRLLPLMTFEQFKDLK